MCASTYLLHRSAHAVDEHLQRDLLDFGVAEDVVLDELEDLPKMSRVNFRRAGINLGQIREST